MPVAVEDPTEIVIVDEPAPGAAIDEGLKLAVAPDGNPDAERAIAELKLPESVVLMVDVPELPRRIVNDDGEAEMAKSLGVPLEVA